MEAGPGSENRLIKEAFENILIFSGCYTIIFLHERLISESVNLDRRAWSE